MYKFKMINLAKTNRFSKGLDFKNFIIKVKSYIKYFIIIDREYGIQ